MKPLLMLGTLSLALVSGLNAGTLMTFEGFAPPGALVNVNPDLPYTEGGFTLTPSNGDSAVFDAAAASQFPGDATSWFGFAAANTITLTGPTPFSLDSALLGPSTIGSGNVDITVTGDLFGGGTVSATFSGLTTATLENIGFTNLVDATFVSTTDAGLDNVSLNGGAVTPEPASFGLFGLGLAALATWKRRTAVRH